MLYISKQLKTMEKTSIFKVTYKNDILVGEIKKEMYLIANDFNEAIEKTNTFLKEIWSLHNLFNTIYRLSIINNLELWQTWWMHRTENPANVVRFHEVPHNSRRYLLNG